MKTRIEKLKKKEKQIKKQKRKKKKKKMLITLIIIITLLILYSVFIEPNILLINEHSIKTDKIKEETHGLKIVHFSDLHYGTYYNINNLDKLIKKINKLKPDIVIFTGDLVDKTYKLNNDDIEYITKEFNNIEYTLGKYAIYGNHDYDIKEYNNILYDSSFKLLKNEYDLIYKDETNPILIYGIDDVLEGEPNLNSLSELEENIFKIILVHEPDYITSIDTNNTDLVLAGHSHNKQVNIPVISNLALPEGAKTYYKSYYKINNTDLYISNGVGCGMFQIRLFTPPSINLYRIIKK